MHLAPTNPEENPELAKLAIEKQKLEIELEKLKLEKSKMFWSSLLGTIPLLAVVATIFYGIWTQQQQEKTQYQLKAAEIMFDAPDGYEMKLRADILNLIMPDKLPAGFSRNFDPYAMGLHSRYTIEDKFELLKMLAAKAKTNDEIVRNWKNIFPADTWVDTLFTSKNRK